MAPVTATAVGMAPQTIDSPKLRELMDRLNSSQVEASDPSSVDRLIAELDNTPTWRFEEQADLYEWIPALNAIDAALSYLVRRYPSMLLVAPVPRRKAKNKSDDSNAECYAKSLDDIPTVPPEATQAVCTLLNFLSNLLRNATSKSVFNSVDELADLLAAADDTVAALALEVLCNLATPPSLHKQQAPEMHQHSTALHSKKTAAHGRLIALARGWGTRGSGLGLLACVTADDSEYGQGSLPTEAGEIHFDFFSNDKEHSLVSVRLSGSDIIEQPLSEDRMMETEETTKKRRRIGSGMKTKSTAELFFRCVQQAGGRDRVPEDRLFSLLADIRLARAFHSSQARVVAIENRLRALITILHSHPSQEIMSGYFQAQPELCVELVDLLRPTVSSASVSAAAARPKDDALMGDTDLQAISALANSPQVPYVVRTLALESLTALVVRRDGASGGLTGVARQSNVLNELGVGKGMYLGLLPTLIRYSLASLSSFLASDEKRSTQEADVSSMDAEAIGLDLGLAFVKATKPASLPPGEQIRRALEFVDTVLTLASAVVSAPSGTAALTDCGLIPALLSTVAFDSQKTLSILSEKLCPEESVHAQSLLRFITSQSVQIIEGAIVTHNNALSAFHDLHGVNTLVSRLSTEIDGVRKSSSSPPEEASENVPMDTGETSNDVEMADASDESTRRSIQSSQRVLLFSIVNCLTVVFHHQESSTTATTSPLGGTQLRKPELTDAVKEILENVDSYGGVLAALTSSLLSDVMNSDPQVVHHVHKSGLAKAFLRMVMGQEDGQTPALAPVPELLMAVPNVLSALSLTEDGATVLMEANPFPAVLSIFYNPKYAMPRSRCLLNEMTAIVGTGLDEIMRHVPRHRPLVMNAIVEAMRHVVELGSNLMEREEAMDLTLQPGQAIDASIEQDRTCLMQYAMNFTQILEQMLHSDEHCEPFVKVGGLDALLTLFPFMMPTGSQFLARVSCLSCPSVCTLAHSTTEDSLSIAVKCIALHYDTHKLLVKMTERFEAQLDSLEALQMDLREAFSSTSDGDANEDGSDHALNAEGILENLPRVPLHDAIENEAFRNKIGCLSRYLRAVVNLQWLSNLLLSTIRGGSQRSQETGSGWGRNEREWKKHISSPSFEKLMKRLSVFCQSSILEACRIRTEDGYETRERDRLRKEPIGSSRVRYRLRIVCQEGAVVRDGTEIDSCASIGTMEMGEIVDGFDRCLNSCGVLRYRTERGWVSELTRGHGREPIAEVLGVWNAQDIASPEFTVTERTKKQVNCGVADVCSASASILARTQNSYSEVFSSLSRVVAQSFKVLPARTMSYESGTVGGHVQSLLRILSSNIQEGFRRKADAFDRANGTPTSTDSSSRLAMSDAGVSVYLGVLLSHLHACLLEEKRERKTLNLPLLISLTAKDESFFRPVQSDAKMSSSSSSDRPLAFLQAIAFLFKQSLSDLRSPSLSLPRLETSDDEKGPSRRLVSRSVAASIPPAVSLMHGLIAGTLITHSTLTSITGRLSDKDIALLTNAGPEELSFRPDYFAKAMKCAVADVLLGVWKDPNFTFAPAHIVHPVASLAGELISSLEEESSRTSRSSRNSGPDGSGAPRLMRRRDPGADVAQGEFVPSEEVVSQLVDMGFSREQALNALENSRSNRIDIAMEYALASGELGLARGAAPGRRSSRQETAPDGEAANRAEEAQDESLPNDAVRDEDMGGSESDAGSEKTKDESADSESSTAVNPDDLLRERITQSLRAWIDSAPQIAFDIMSGDAISKRSSTDSSIPEQTVPTMGDSGKGEGDAEAEALTVVLSSFILDLCQRYPDERTRIMSDLISRLKTRFTEVQNDKNGSSAWDISQHNACSFASLCHATVLCTRALPKTRILVLKQGLVQCLVSSIQSFAQSLSASCASKEQVKWPIWLAPSLLLLDVMAQPMTAFSDKTVVDDDDEEDKSIDAEFFQVREEHKQQAAAITETADAVFSALRDLERKPTEDEKSGDTPMDEVGSRSILDASGKDCHEKRSSGSEAGEKKPPDEADDSSVHRTPFSSVPPYFPMIPSESANACMLLCLDLLGKSCTDGATQFICPPPGIVQAVLFLLTRLIRSPQRAAQCLRLGAADLILSLPRECRFDGAAGVATIVLRRLLEDETTLQSAMGVEIRCTVTKLYGRDRLRQRDENERPRVPTRAFAQAATPLICRDPMSFLKAAATTICIESKEPQDSQSTVVALLSPEQSARNSRVIADVLNSNDARVTEAAAGMQERRGPKTPSATKMPKPKAERRLSSSKRKHKKEKSEGVSRKCTSLNGTPANHISCLLISRIISLANDIADVPGEVNGDTEIDLSNGVPLYGESRSCFWLADALEIMADLVLAMPACAAAIHRYRSGNQKERSSRGVSGLEVCHALSGSPSPPRTFVNFLLHSVLPQDRWSFKRDQQKRVLRNGDDESMKLTKQVAHMRSRVAQTSARLLVSLVARAGEGRRRVIADLAFALSGGRLGHVSMSSMATPSNARSSDDHEFHALQSWGELCIGLAAPRSNGVNFDNASVLSLEVVKLMLDFGMAHGLLYAIQRVPLQHPMAASTCTSLLVPLEVFTRRSVSDAVQTVADKEAAKAKRAKDDAASETKIPKRKKISESTPGVSAGPSQRSESSFADDTMLEDGFDAETAARTSRSRARAMAQGIDYDANNGDEGMEGDIGEYGMMEDDEGSNGSEENDVEMEDADESDNEAGIDEEVSSDDESDVTEEIDDEDSETGSDDNDGSGGSDEDEIEDDFEDEDDGGLEWEEGNANDFLGNVAEEEADESGGFVGQGESELDEGWTRVEPGGFGGMMLAARRVPPRAPGAPPHLSTRSRGFIDAAEAMIGSLLRTGEIEGSALAELEGTLGIRIMPQLRGVSTFDNPGDDDGGRGSRVLDVQRLPVPPSARTSSGDAVVTMPHIHQRSPPDSGYSAFGGGMRWAEVGSMEYVYGGPSVAAGHRNYDVSLTQPRESEAGFYPTPAQIDGHLFPGGPAAATHSRAQQSVHPLLCGVELPPVNALVSDLLPHGQRATHHSQTGTPRSPGSGSFSSGSYLVSTSGGNVVRLTRGGPFSDFHAEPSTRTAAAEGMAGWTDDGLPFDGALGDFSSAFERALGESMMPVLSASAPRQATEESSTSAGQSDQPDSNAQRSLDAAEEETAEQDPSAAAGADAVSAETNPPAAAEANMDTSDGGSPAAAASGDDPGTPTTDGDGVASSLATGLRLSEACGSSEQDTVASAQPADAPGESRAAPDEEGDNAEAARPTNASDSPPTQDEEMPAEEENAVAASEEATSSAQVQEQEQEASATALTCPPGMDQEVFSCLPVEMQREVVEQHRTAAEVAGQLDSASGLDPEALAALPEDMRQEVIEQDQRERRLREQAPADPSNAEEMDNASFIASLAPALREEILMTADEGFLNTLPPNIIAEAQILRERASTSRRGNDDAFLARGVRVRHYENARNGAGAAAGGASSSGASRKKLRTGKVKVDCDRTQILYLPAEEGKQLSPLMGFSDLKALLRLMYLRSPVRPPSLLQKVFKNLCTQGLLRNILSAAFVELLSDNGDGAVESLKRITREYTEDKDDWRKKIDEYFLDANGGFPPAFLIGAAPEVFDTEDFNPNVNFFTSRRRQNSSTADSIAANLPTSAKGSHEQYLPPVVATRIIDTVFHLSKSLRLSIDALTNGTGPGESVKNANIAPTCFDKLLDLLEKPRYANSSNNLDQLLNLIEVMVTPLSALPKPGEEEHEIPQRDIDAAESSGKEWVDVPHIVVSQSRLQLLCSILRMESCKDSAFTKVNSIARRLCRVDANRGYILGELGAVAQALAADAIRDLKSLNIRMQDAALAQQREAASDPTTLASVPAEQSTSAVRGGTASSSVALSISSSELKLLRVLQTLQSLCVDTSQEDSNGKKNDGPVVVTGQLVEIFRAMRLDDLWTHLDSCLHAVKVLEGVTTVEEMDEKGDGNDNDTDDASDDNGPNGKKLQNSVAGLLTRFLPVIEAFFVVNASSQRATSSSKAKPEDKESAEKSNDEEGTPLSPTTQKRDQAQKDEDALNALVGGKRLVEFGAANRVLLNALIRNNPALLEKGLRAMVYVPQCRALLDFDVKRHWFKTQVRRLRQHASRRHGSLRLSIRRKFVFEDAYHQLRLRNADEMRGRLQITFRNEEGVDAGGLSREFFGILAKEMFNPNYALFTSTEDGCTFQPNPNSSINPDHLSYFRFVGRIVGKAVADGFLLDAHFTRSLYKHMLGEKPTYHDMEAIDPDYYKNLQMILEHNLADIGLDLTFSIEDYSFGRSRIIDLLPNGRNVPVTEETKSEYVSLVCQHRMTTAISSQIKAYQDGFYELVSRDLIAIFTPRELELLISGLPDIDVHDLRANTEYQGYRAADKEIQWFWNILFSLSRSEKAAFLQFVTGSSKVPLAGFSELQGMRGVQKFSIHKAGGSSGALMSAHTCFNSLDLPVYKSEEETREKLLYAINEGQTGFAFA